jgi:hypothetical protein
LAPLTAWAALHPLRPKAAWAEAGQGAQQAPPVDLAAQELIRQAIDGRMQSPAPDVADAAYHGLRTTLLSAPSPMRSPFCATPTPPAGPTDLFPLHTSGPEALEITPADRQCVREIVAVFTSLSQIPFLDGFMCIFRLEVRSLPGSCSPSGF